jgi:hypothetical protein
MYQACQAANLLWDSCALHCQLHIEIPVLEHRVEFLAQCFDTSLKEQMRAVFAPLLLPLAEDRLPLA